MNSLANCLNRVSLRCSPLQNKAIVSYMSTAVKENVSIRKRKPINKAMRAYIDRVKAYEQKMLVASEDFQKGKRFLAVMMGEDPETFNQYDIDKSIEYLLPSSIYQKFCRPLMKPPEELYPQVKEAKFDESGRPFHFMFYTGAPLIYEVQYDAASILNGLDRLQDQIHMKGRLPQKEDKFDLVGSEWLNQIELEKKLNEKIRPEHFEATMKTLERLIHHPMSAHCKDFIKKFRKEVMKSIEELEIPTPQEDADGRLFIEAKGNRKRSEATVILRSPGTGKISINGSQDILFFEDVQSRQQVLYPLQLAGLLGKVDVEATVSGGGFTGQAGAIRHATSLALRSFVDSETLIKMQIAGLLTYDRRTRERKKPGQAGARRKYTWLKR